MTRLGARSLIEALPQKLPIPVSDVQDSSIVLTVEPTVALVCSSCVQGGQVYEPWSDYVPSIPVVSSLIVP